MATSKTKQSALRPPKVTEPPDEMDPPQQGIGRRAGSILAGPETDAGSPIGGKTAGDDLGVMPDRSPASVPRTADGNAQTRAASVGRHVVVRRERHGGELIAASPF